MASNTQLAELLQWYADIGVDEAIGEEPVDRTKQAPLATAAILAMESPAAAGDDAAQRKPLPLLPAQSPVPAAAPAVTGAVEAIKEAATRAAAAKTIEELKAALDSFPGLALKRTATQMIFADGNPQARVMVIGEVPGADEDRAGRPFVGENGALLDKMLAAIGLTRAENVYLTTIINWRPPGNRNPEPAEIAMSVPFIKRHIALLKPSAIMFVGGAPAKILLGTKAPIMSLRGKWLDYIDEDAGLKIPAMAMLHPEYLSKNPAQKKPAWEDLQMFQARLKELGI